jgi:cytoskeletal protein CcmA (bactofilin family)
MNKKNSASEFSINSLVGEDTIFYGIFESKGPFRIDGYFKGKINSFGKIYIGKSGVAECEIIAKNIIIGGTVKGDVYAEEFVQILKTGKVIGNIYASSMNMDDSVIFDGECKILEKEEINKIIDEKRNEKFIFG